jgi:hypothetical protein
VTGNRLGRIWGLVAEQMAGRGDRALSGLGARLYPGGLATPTPQSFSVVSRTAIWNPPEVPAAT